MALRRNELFLSYGVMGGFMQVRETAILLGYLLIFLEHQPQGHVQVLLNMLRGFTAQAALDAPRFCISAGTPQDDDTDDEFGVVNSEVYFEDAILPATIAKLRGGYLSRGIHE